MKTSNVRLILFRELKDQLRDRRTIFTIAVLPLLLYPLLGMTFLQVAEFLRSHPTRVWVLGAAALPEQPPLLVTTDGGRWSFHQDVVSGPEADLFDLEVAEAPPAANEAADQQAQRALAAGRYDAVIVFPPDFAERLGRYRTGQSPEAHTPAAAPYDPQAPQPQVYFDAARDKSRVARDRIALVMDAWRELIVRENLARSEVSPSFARPFVLADADIAAPQRRSAAVWSKILPFIVLVWALTGAFYPAIDLCAGEKERGTLETLLCSPALRSEIVCGKLLAVMTFSIATAVLNLASMAATGTFIISRLKAMGAASPLIDVGPPPWGALGWLLVALVPIAALFSALALAIAAQARSSKEGQYYLMPLLLISMPLMVLPMLPAAELDLGMALIPVTGMMMLLRALVEGRYLEALLYTVPVLAVTAGCCLLAIRWAVNQFNDESVLFRESERWSLGLWLAHLVRDRMATPTVAMALLCGVLLLVIRFIANLTASYPGNFAEFAFSTVVLQVALIAAPVLIMALLFTRSPQRTLLLVRPQSTTLAAAVLLAVAIHPLALLLAQAIGYLYPMSAERAALMAPLQQMLLEAPLPAVLLAFALVPAICEELAFRGFILSGLRHSGHKWGAILVAAVFFGVTHGILQQSLIAVALGVVLGFLAVQTGSLYPCIAFHMVYNGLGLAIARLSTTWRDRLPMSRVLFEEVEGGFAYSTTAIATGAVVTVLLLLWFGRLPYRPTEEESLQKALDHQSLHAGAP